MAALLLLSALIMMSVPFAPPARAQSVVATVSVGSSPIAAAYDSSKGEVFVANYDDGTVSVISVPGSAVSTTMTTSASSTTSSGGGGGIPEFPFQLGFTLLVTAIVVTSYALTRRVTFPRH